MLRIHQSHFSQAYDLVNLSNILFYRFKEEDIDKVIAFMKDNFTITETGEVINYCFGLKQVTEAKAQ